jgi:hypothetical protein
LAQSIQHDLGENEREQNRKRKADKDAERGKPWPRGLSWVGFGRVHDRSSVLVPLTAVGGQRADRARAKREIQQAKSERFQAHGPRNKPTRRRILRRLS